MNDICIVNALARGIPISGVFFFLKQDVNFSPCLTLELRYCRSSLQLTFCVSDVKTESAEELGSVKQTYQGWLLLLVHAFISDWYSGFGGCHMAVGQIFVKIKNTQLVKFLFFSCF